MTEDELRQLNIISERAKILLGFHEGTSISKIARELGTNRPKVERTIDKAFAFGILVALVYNKDNARVKFQRHYFNLQK